MAWACYARGMTVAWILAAGLGTRLAPLTRERPKPLVEVCGRPLVVHTLQLLADAGVTTVGLNSHWLHPALPRALGRSVDVDGRQVAITTTYEPTVLGTGGGLLGLRSVLPGDGDRVLIANADALIDLDVAALLGTPRGPLSTLVLKEVDDVLAYGAIGTDFDDQVVTFAGRIPPRGPIARERMFCGWHFIEPHALEVLPPVSVELSRGDEVDGTAAIVRGTESCINKEGYPTWLCRGAVLTGFDHAGLFLDVGTPERLWEANRLLLSGEFVTSSLRPFARFQAHPNRVFVHPSASIDSGARLEGPCLVDEGAIVEAGAVIGPYSVVGKQVVVRPGVTLRRAIVQSGQRGHHAVDVDATDVHVGETCRVGWHT